MASLPTILGHHGLGDGAAGPAAEKGAAVATTQLSPRAQAQKQTAEGTAPSESSDSVDAKPSAALKKSSGGRPPLYMYVLASCAALNSVNIGFDIGVSSGAAIFLREDFQLEDIEVGIFLGSIHFLAALGGMASNVLTDRLGRRRCFTICQLINIIGIAIMVFSSSFPVLMVGRFIVGFGTGIGFAVDPLYIAEISPASYRGAMTSWSETAINVGIFLGFCCSLVLSELPLGANWRAMVACGASFPVALLAMSLLVMPESPRWLVGRGRQQEAADILGRTHPKGTDVSAIMKEIQDQVAEDQVLGQQGWAPLFSPGGRWRLLVGMGVAMAQQLNGSESVIYYSPIIFQEAGVADPDDVRGLFLATSLVGFVKFTFVALSACVVDTWGRRPLLIASTTFMALSLVLVSLAVSSGNGALAVFSVCAFVASFSFGIGPVTWLFAAELFSSEVRAKSMSLAVSLNRITSGTIALTFLPMSKALGGAGGYFGFFSAVTAMTSVMMFCFVPETKGKTLESLGRDVSESGSRSNDQLNA